MVIVNLLAMISLKKIIEALYRFNLVWFKEHKNCLEQIIKKKGMIHFVYIVTYLGKILNFMYFHVFFFSFVMSIYSSFIFIHFKKIKFFN